MIQKQYRIYENDVQAAFLEVPQKMRTSEFARAINTFMGAAPTIYPLEIDHPKDFQVFLLTSQPISCEEMEVILDGYHPNE